MVLMVVLGVMLILGLGATVWWGSSQYVVWPQRPDADGETEPAPYEVKVSDSARRYLRGAAVALVAGFWTGALVTGPSMRLIMRLLAVTGGDAAQGRTTEAGEI